MLLFFIRFIGSVNTPDQLQGIAFHTLAQRIFVLFRKIPGDFIYLQYQLVGIPIYR